jgi:hypothetical protein
MRHLSLAAMLILLLAASRSHAQEQAPSPEELPVQPSPATAPPPPGPPPYFAPGVAPTASAPPLFPDATLDGFATRFWFSVDYLLWWTKGDQLPPLATTGSQSDAIPGALGQPGTQVLFGGDYNTQVRSGARFRGGYWFTPDQLIGIDGTFFFLGPQGTRFSAFSPGDPILTRPFFDINNNREDSFLVAYPGKQGGFLSATDSNFLWGADTNLRSLLFRGPSYQVSVLGGFRFLDLHDSLRINETDVLYPQGSGDVTTWAMTADRFHTSNQFYGGQLGTDLRWGRGRFSVDVLTKIALGASVERATINGCSSFMASNGSQAQVGIGELALPTNIGWAEKDQFAVVPEVGVNLGYALTRHFRLTFGYTFLYWSSVFRPGDQIDRAINTTEFSAVYGGGTINGPQRPNFTFASSDFWAQGLNFGGEFRY